MPLERALPEHDESAERLRVLAWLAARRGTPCSSRRCWRSSSARSPRSSWRAARSTFASGSGSSSAPCSSALVAGGYDSAVEVSGVGEFAIRGGIVDVWPPGAGEPVRLDLFGDEVESIRAFDPVTQARGGAWSEVTLLPAGEFLPAEGWRRSPSAAPRDLTDAAAGGPGQAGAGRRGRGGRDVGGAAHRRDRGRSPAGDGAPGADRPR